MKHFRRRDIFIIVLAPMFFSLAASLTVGYIIDYNSQNNDSFGRAAVDAALDPSDAALHKIDVDFAHNFY